MINLLLSDSKNTSAFVWQKSDLVEEINNEFTMSVTEQSMVPETSTACGV